MDAAKIKYFKYFSKDNWNLTTKRFFFRLFIYYDFIFDRVKKLDNYFFNNVNFKFFNLKNNLILNFADILLLL